MQLHFVVERQFTEGRGCDPCSTERFWGVTKPLALPEVPRFLSSSNHAHCARRGTARRTWLLWNDATVVAALAVPEGWAEGEGKSLRLGTELRSSRHAASSRPALSTPTPGLHLPALLLSLQSVWVSSDCFTWPGVVFLGFL